MIPYVVRAYTNGVTVETDVKITEIKKKMVPIEEHRELEKRVKQLEEDRDKAASALLIQRRDIDLNQENIKNVEKDTKKNKEDIESLEKRVRDLEGKLLVDADTLKDIQASCPGWFHRQSP